MELGQNADTQSSDSTSPYKIIPSSAATVWKDIKGRGLAMQWTCNFKLTSLRNFLHSFEYLPLVNDYKSKAEMPSHNIWEEADSQHSLLPPEHVKLFWNFWK